MSGTPELKYYLTIDAVEHELPQAPSGWENTLIAWERSGDYFGMFRNFSMPMVFVTAGAKLLRTAFYERGVRAECILRIDRLSRPTWQYSTVYTGDLDFTTFQDRMHEVEISVMERGAGALIKAYANVQYEIPVDDPEAVTVRVPGIGLVEKGSAIIGGGDFPTSAQVIRAMEVDVLENGFVSGSVVYQSVDQEIISDMTTSGAWHVEAVSNTSMTFKGRISGSYINRPGETVFLDVRNQNNTLRQRIAQLIQVSTSQIPFDVEFQFNIDILAGERLFFVIASTGTTRILTLNGGDMEATNALTTPDTPCKALRPDTLFRRLMAKMNGGPPVETQSFFLNSENWRRVVVTCGDAIRQIPGAKIKTSFRQFFESYNAMGNIGLGVEAGVPVLEQKAYFMQQGLISLDVGAVKEFSLEPATGFLYSSIKTGYNDFDYEAEYGREEVNSGQQWVTPLTRSQNELNLVSPYRADQFGIEEQRLTPAEQNRNNTDKEWDNDVFVIKIQAVENDGMFDVEGAEAYESIKGFSDRNSYYNLDLTPKKNLLRHGDFLASMLHRYGGRHIRFESADKNADVSTVDLQDRTVTENEWIQISGLPEPLFLPYIAKIRCKTPRNAAAFMATFPRGFVRFTYLDREFRGFIMDAASDVARNSDQEFSLLLTPDNSLGNLVH